MAILLFDDSRRAPRSAVGDAVYGDDVVLSPLPRHYQKSQKKAAAATTTSITASAILWTYTCISFACNLTRVGARCRALARVAARQPRVAARQGFNGNARQRAMCERGFMHMQTTPRFTVTVSRLTLAVLYSRCPSALTRFRRE